MLDGAAADASEEPDLVLCLAGQLRPTQIARPLTLIGMGLFASKGYLARHGAPAHPCDLPEHDCLTYGTSLGRHCWSFDSPGQGGSHTVEVRGVLNSNDMGVLTEAAVHGVGVVVLPRIAAGPFVEFGGLQRILPEWTVAAQMLHVAYRSRKNLPMAVRKLVEHLVFSFGGHEWDGPAQEYGGDSPGAAVGQPAGALHRSVGMQAGMAT
jgi:DNA-binding transcriptional LysR family regulator